ncbi:hypothetical protein GCM10023238_05640 [Streptomyces heliomycini]
MALAMAIRASGEPREISRIFLRIGSAEKRAERARSGTRRSALAREVSARAPLSRRRPARDLVHIGGRRGTVRRLSRRFPAPLELAFSDRGCTELLAGCKVVVTAVLLLRLLGAAAAGST